MESKDLVGRIGNVDFELTYLCNLNCRHCYNPTHAKSKEFSTGQVQAIAEQVKKAGFQEIHFNGGEPLIRKDIYEILRHSGNIGLRTILETNSVLLSEPESLARIRGIIVRASIDGSESAHNAIRRNKTGENAYRTAMDNLGNARKEGVKIQVTCSVNRMNYDTIYEMVADACQRGLDDVRLRLSMPSGFAAANWECLEMERNMLEEVYTSSKRIEKDFPSLRFNYASLRRGVPDFEPKFFIDPRGMVKPYPFIEYFIGDLNTDSVETVLERIPSAHLPQLHKEKMMRYLAKLGMVKDE